MASTDWFQNAIIYHLMIDRFAGLSSPEGLQPEFLGGNLPALTEKLPYLEDLGITALWLSPFCETTAYHGYHVTDFFRVEPRFGTPNDLRVLIERAHRTGIRVIADFVPNHCSRSHPFFREAQGSRQSRYVPWFFFTRWPDRYLCFLDVPELPKLNLDYPEARDHIVAAAKQWLSLGLDGFRLDHVIGPTHTFWSHFRTEIKRDYPAAVLIGEAWLEGISRRHLRTLNIRNNHLRWLFGVSQEAIQKEYVGELDGVLDFRFRSFLFRHIVADGNRAARPEQIIRERLASYPAGYHLPTFLDNHDTNRFLYDCRNNREKLKAAARLQFSLDQPPIIYYGTEAGMTHESPVDVGRPHSDLQARQQMPWKRQDAELLAFYRELIRRRKERTPSGGSPLSAKGPRRTNPLDIPPGSALHDPYSASPAAN